MAANLESNHSNYETHFQSDCWASAENDNINKFLKAFVITSFLRNVTVLDCHLMSNVKQQLKTDLV